MIFISPFDLFGEKKFMYTFSMRCNENPELCLQDGAVRIFLNTKGTNYDDVPEELVEFLHFAEKPNADGMNIKSERVKSLTSQIESIKTNHEVGVKYMQLWEEIKYYCADAKEEALAEGLEIGRNEGQVLKLIYQIRKKFSKNMTPEEISDLLEEDLSVVETIFTAIKDMPMLSDEEIYTRIFENRQR